MCTNWVVGANRKYLSPISRGSIVSRVTSKFKAQRPIRSTGAYSRFHQLVFYRDAG